MSDTVSNFYTLQQAVIDCLTFHLEQINQALNTCYSLPTVSYTQRGTIAGSAHLLKWHIRLNKQLLIENGQSFINQVIPHELAHLIVFKHVSYHAQPHGKEWKTIMSTIFLRPPLVKHQFDVSNIRKNSYCYICSCQIHQLSQIRHNKIQRNTAVYHCRRCKQILRFKKDNTL